MDGTDHLRGVRGDIRLSAHEPGCRCDRCHSNRPPPSALETLQIVEGLTATSGGIADQLSPRERVRQMLLASI
jgi:hypothetical protein